MRFFASSRRAIIWLVQKQHLGRCKSAAISVFMRSPRLRLRTGAHQIAQIEQFNELVAGTAEESSGVSGKIARLSSNDRDIPHQLVALAHYRA